MDEKKRRMVSFEIDVDELESIEARAAKAGLSRSEYLRARAISEPAEPSSSNLEALIKQVIYMANQIYVGLFSIAEAQGQARRFLSSQELRKVYDQVRAAALNYAVEFPEHFEAVQAEIAARAKNGAK
jgi:hypothetical protein